MHRQARRGRRGKRRRARDARRLKLVGQVDRHVDGVRPAAAVRDRDPHAKAPIRLEVVGRAGDGSQLPRRGVDRERGLVGPAQHVGQHVAVWIGRRDRPADGLARARVLSEAASRRRALGESRRRVGHRARGRIVEVDTVDLAGGIDHRAGVAARERAVAKRESQAAHVVGIGMPRGPADQCNLEMVTANSEETDFKDVHAHRKAVGKARRRQRGGHVLRAGKCAGRRAQRSQALHRAVVALGLGEPLKGIRPAQGLRLRLLRGSEEERKGGQDRKAGRAEATRRSRRPGFRTLGRR